MIDDTLPRTPLRVPDVVVEQSADGAVLRGAEGPPVSVNPTALALWELCDGTNTLEEMVYAVCELFNIDESKAACDVQHALHSLHSNGLVSRPTEH
jgi:hypothetical protein